MEVNGDLVPGSKHTLELVFCPLWKNLGMHIMHLMFHCHLITCFLCTLIMIHLNCGSRLACFFAWSSGVMLNQPCTYVKQSYTPLPVSASGYSWFSWYLVTNLSKNSYILSFIFPTSRTLTNTPISLTIWLQLVELVQLYILFFALPAFLWIFCAHLLQLKVLFHGFYSQLIPIILRSYTWWCVFLLK